MSQKKMHQNTPNIELWPNTNSGPAKKALDGGRPHNKNKTSIDFKGYSRSDHVSSLKHVKVQKEEVVFVPIIVLVHFRLEFRPQPWECCQALALY